MKDERYDLSKEFVISDEVKTKYNQTKERVIGYRKACAVVTVGTIATFIGINYLRDFFTESSSDYLGAAIIALVVGVIFIILGLKKMKRFSKKHDGTDVVDSYLSDCIEPIVSQIDEDVKVTHSVIALTKNGLFLPYADVSDYVEENTHSKSQETVVDDPLREAAVKYVNNNYYNGKALGETLCKKYVVPRFSHDFTTNVCISTLDTNEQGFLFTNAEATSKSYDSDGNESTTINFEGPIVVVRTKLKARCDVSLYTSGKSLIRKKETSNGYLTIKDTIDTENEAFNEAFQVTAEEQSQAFYILSPLVMENLLKIKERYGNFGLNVHNEYLIFGFNSMKQPLAMPETIKEAKELSLEKSVKEVAEMLEMVYQCKDAIDLNLPDPTKKKISSL